MLESRRCPGSRISVLRSFGKPNESNLNAPWSAYRVYTVTDEELFRLLRLLNDTEGLKLEPSALAGAPGFARVLQENQGYRHRLGMPGGVPAGATHLIWGTGGGMVPEAEMNGYLQKTAS